MAESTQADRERKGFPADEPLLRTGAMRDSIEYTVISDTEGTVGSNSDIAVYQELGTSHIPPRSFLASAAMATAPEIAKMAGKATAAALAGESLAEIHEILHVLHYMFEQAKGAAETLLEDEDEEQGRHRR